MMYKTYNNQQHLSITLATKTINEYVLLLYGRQYDYRIRCHVPTSKCGHVPLTVHIIDTLCGLTYDRHDRVDHHTKQNYHCPYSTHQNMKLKKNLCSVRQQGQIFIIVITSNLFIDIRLDVIRFCHPTWQYLSKTNHRLCRMKLYLTELAVRPFVVYHNHRHQAIC